MTSGWMNKGDLVEGGVNDFDIWWQNELGEIEESEWMNASCGVIYLKRIIELITQVS